MRLVFCGSGAFALPTLRRLADAHDIALVVTQPDRPAGRHRVLTPTPIGEFAEQRGMTTIKPDNINHADIVAQISGTDLDALVVIAFGQKLGRDLLGMAFNCNLHASLLPKYRGAAPIQWAMISGEKETGVSVIGLADRMDAGPIYGLRSTAIDPAETAGELHDRLAELGPEAVEQVLSQLESGRLMPQEQDERLASRASKLAKSDGTVRFDQPANLVRCRVHGLTPWPGCTIKLENQSLRLARVQTVDEITRHSNPGTLLDDLSVACASGSIRVLEVQPPGGKLMSFDAYRHGQPVRAGMRMNST